MLAAPGVHASWHSDQRQQQAGAVGTAHLSSWALSVAISLSCLVAAGPSGGTGAMYADGGGGAAQYGLVGAGMPAGMGAMQRLSSAHCTFLACSNSTAAGAARRCFPSATSHVPRPRSEFQSKVATPRWPEVQRSARSLQTWRGASLKP
jgi:hypothetical protein